MLIILLNFRHGEYELDYDRSSFGIFNNHYSCIFHICLSTIYFIKQSFTNGEYFKLKNSTAFLPKKK